MEESCFLATVLGMFCVLWLCVVEAHSWDVIHRADTDQFPWLVAYRTTFRSYSANIPEKCGGVLVTPSWVLTAAHCLDIEAGPHNYTVFAGSKLSFLVAEDRARAQALGYQFRSISALYRHPMFSIEPERLAYATKNSLYFQYNIALLNTEHPFERGAQPIALTEVLGRDCFILGLGAHDLDDHLVYMSVGAVPFTYCTRLRNISNSRSICVRQRDGSVPCGGDPGTPLVCVNDRDQERMEVMGISSCNDEGLRCGVTSRYLLVGIFRQWIEETITEGNNYKQHSLLNPYMARLRALNTTGLSTIRAQPTALTMLTASFNVLSKLF